MQADFSPFSREKSEPQESAVSRWAPEAAYSSDPADVKGADSCSEVRTNHDADFALALQMQQEVQNGSIVDLELISSVSTRYSATEAESSVKKVFARNIFGCTN